MATNLLTVGVRISRPEFGAFVDILCNIQQNVLRELGPNFGGKNPMIAGTVSFHLHFGGINLLFC